MAKLVPCKTCKKEVASNAKVCPHCGEKNPTVTAKDTIGGIVIAGVIIWIISVFLSDDNSKTIYKKDYGDKWAFSSDSAILKCYNDGGDIKSPVIIIDGENYGLTGFADMKYGQNNLDALKKVWLKSKKYEGLMVDIGPFTEEALELCD